MSALRRWLAWFGSSGYSQSIPAALLTGPSFATCRIIRNPPASGSLLMICHNRMLLRSLSGVAYTTPDTSKSQPTAYCFAQLKQGTCLIRLKTAALWFCQKPAAFSSEYCILAACFLIGLYLYTSQPFLPRGRISVTPAKSFLTIIKHFPKDFNWF